MVTNLHQQSLVHNYYLFLGFFLDFPFCLASGFSVFVVGFCGGFFGRGGYLVFCGFLLVFLIGDEGSFSSLYRCCKLEVSEAVQAVCATK